ncbi:tRNA epoxyqueuosine(34) reductase QueG [Gottschalkiaceae bacterium SANA]|nr:tRNA epoxyqueuosine(34) reductase QueG [Gottschalkiaceae bacterium SANA]
MNGINGSEITKGLSIEIIGAMPARALDQTREFLIGRKKAGQEIEFEETDVNRRVDPGESYGSVATMLIVGLPIPKQTWKKAEDPMRGSLSVFAVGEDYHLLMQRQIKILMERLEETGLQGSVQVDTGPLLERAFAREAGGGFQGKNTTIIHPNWGSFFFLGLILLDKDVGLEGTLVEDGCGSCMRCQQVCPVSALDESYRMDIRRCLSYWTQAKASVPFWIRERWGNRIYGCDSCQIVCPWNQDQITAERTSLWEAAHPDLLAVLAMNKTKFREQFLQTAAGWRGRNVLRRNALLALARPVCSSGFDQVSPYLQDPSAMIRSTAAWTLIRMDEAKGRDLILKRMEEEKETSVREEWTAVLAWKSSVNMTDC